MHNEAACIQEVLKDTAAREAIAATLPLESPRDPALDLPTLILGETGSGLLEEEGKESGPLPVEEAAEIEVKEDNSEEPEVETLHVTEDNSKDPKVEKAGEAEVKEEEPKEPEVKRLGSRMSLRVL